MWISATGGNMKSAVGREGGLVGWSEGGREGLQFCMLKYYHDQICEKQA